MIDSMFWPFAMKVAAERHNSLSVNAGNQTPSSVLYNVELKSIPVKTFHTFFCPVYVLAIRSQSAGGPGPPKWEPRCRIGVYFEHSQFHAGSVALVFNPTTGLVSPQFHLIFDDSFSTVSYMNAGTTPPNWADLVIYSSDLSADNEFELAENWTSNLPQVVPESDRVPDPALDRITNPFAVVPDPTSASGNETNAPLTQNPVLTRTEGGATISKSPSREHTQQQLRK